MRLSVESVIYLYIFICVVLLVFNILYISRSKWVKKRKGHRIRRWEARLREHTRLSERDVRSLRKIDQLTAFSTALSRTEQDSARWFQDNIRAVQSIAAAYVRRPAMERAFAAYWIAGFETPVSSEQSMLPQVILQYLEHATVFCRENTLHALYALGLPGMVEHAFQWISDRHIYHNPKLLSDGMLKYTGDPDQLISRLWRHRADWEECLTVGVIQYAAMQSSSAWHEPFLEALRDHAVPLEIRFALIRYFQRHPLEQALPELLSLARADAPAEKDLKVAAVSALEKYEGEEVHQVLLDSLRDANWYVRRNAAQSLTRRGISEADRAAVRSTGDRYALEMLEYMAFEEGGNR